MVLRNISIVISLCFSASALCAELSWEYTRVEIKAKPGQSSVEVDFPFQNNGQDVVHIETVESSCSCTSAIVGKSTIAPGESGAVTTVFEFGEREGLQQKQVKVITDKQKQTTLFLVVDIPRLYEVEPRRLIWSLNDDSTQSYRITNVSTNPVAVVSVTSSNTDFTPELKEIQPGFEYALLVTPKKLSRRAQAVITITTEPICGQTPKSYRVYAVCD